MKNIFFTPFILLCFQGLCQVTPQLILPKTMPVSRGDQNYHLYGFLPFRGENILIAAYNGADPKYNNAFQELQTTSFALPNSNIKASALYVELLSFIPKSSFGRFSGAIQLTQADLQDSLKRSQQSMALQKLLNGGGNLNINFSRPLYYKASRSGKGHTLLNFSSTMFLDGMQNSKLSTAGLGFIPNLDFDWRLFSNKKSMKGNEARQVGNLIRAGVKGRAFANVFNSKFEAENSVDKEMNNFAALAIGGYLGLGPLIWDFSYTTDNKGLLQNQGWMFNFKFQPVKW